MRKIMNPQEIIEHILLDKNVSPSSEVNVFAPINIALCKYWGKSDTDLRLPNSSSLSISLPTYGASLQLSGSTQEYDSILINDKKIDVGSKLSLRIQKYLDYFRKVIGNQYFSLRYQMNVPLGAGMASSSCLFAALVKGLNAFYNWSLPKRMISILSRLGSGSSCRSHWDGFVMWPKSDIHPFGSHGMPLEVQWKELCLGILLISEERKAIGSTEGMEVAQQTSPYYAAWLHRTEQDFEALKEAIQLKDFEKVGPLVESNALAMHATTMTSWPPFSYYKPATMKAMQEVWDLRNKENISVFFTQDAGPNLKLLFLEHDKEVLLKKFPELKVSIPFQNQSKPQ